jgi:tRNA(Arg) A34 adenosine deaminase TadA
VVLLDLSRELTRQEARMSDDTKAEQYLIGAIRAAMDNVRRRTNAPFGAVIVRNDEVIATAVNQVDDLCDPTAHAEMQAVRAAAKALNSTDLSGATVYASGFPCAMCLTAMYLSGVEKVYYAYSNEDGAPYGLGAERGYVEIARAPDQREMKLQGLRARDDGEDLYEAWKKAASACP